MHGSNPLQTPTQLPTQTPTQVHLVLAVEDNPLFSLLLIRYTNLVYLKYLLHCHCTASDRNALAVADSSPESGTAHDTCYPPLSSLVCILVLSSNLSYPPFDRYSLQPKRPRRPLPRYKKAHVHTWKCSLTGVAHRSAFSDSTQLPCIYTLQTPTTPPTQTPTQVNLRLVG